MNYSRKTTIADYPEMNQGLPIQQVMDAAREMSVDPETNDRG